MPPLPLVTLILTALPLVPLQAEFDLPGSTFNELPRQERVAPAAGIGTRPGSSKPGADPFMLMLNSRTVQQDMQLTEEQLRHLSHTGKLFRGQVEREGGPTGPAANKERAEQSQMARGAVAKILSPEQLERLRQIMLQIEGPCALTKDQRLAKQLRLEPARQQQIARICQKMDFKAEASLRPPPSGQRSCQSIQEGRQEVERIRSQGLNDARAVLSEAQAHDFARMQGAPIRLEPMMPPHCQDDGPLRGQNHQ
jgi:hypothetical protein